MPVPNQRSSKKLVPDNQEKIENDNINKRKKEDKNADTDNAGRRNSPL